MERSNRMNDGIEILSDPEKVDMADDWYAFANLHHFWIRARFAALKLHLSRIELSGSTLFEVGCGNGLIINQFETAFDTMVDGCDLNMLALRQAKGHRGKLYCLNIFTPPKTLLRKYDGVLLMDVLEHIADDTAFLKASLEFVRDDGIVVINVPAFNFFFSKYDTAAGHKRRYTKKMMRTLFEANNIVPLAQAYWGFTLVPVVLLRKLVLKVTGKKNTIKTGFQPPNEMVHRLLRGLLAFERRTMRSPWIGTSLIAIGRIERND